MLLHRKGSRSRFSVLKTPAVLMGREQVSYPGRRDSVGDIVLMSTSSHVMRKKAGMETSGIAWQ